MEYYMQKTYYKTASLISNSCKAIALLAGQTAEVAVLAYEYGRNLVCKFFLILLSVNFFKEHDLSKKKKILQRACGVIFLSL
jgi:geranyl diphosphate synthase